MSETIENGKNSTQIEDRLVEDQKSSELEKRTNLSKSQIITIVLLSFFFFLTSSYYSLLAPFLPQEAIKKGMSQTQIGIIFGVYQLILLVLSPIFGKYLDVIGIRFLFVGGLFLSSGSEIIFSVLKMSPNGWTYFILMVACRIVTAIGSSMGLSYAIVGFYFPNRISTMIALLEVMNGLGLMIGPPIGGFLFEIGGFQLPFLVMGGIEFLVFVIAFFTFPDAHSIPPDTDLPVVRTLPMMNLLKMPKFLVTLFMLLIGSISIGFIEPSIELHLDPLNLSPVELGFVLFIPSLTYVVMCPIVGYFCDKYPKSMPWFMFLSALISAISFSFFGPIPWINLPLNLPIFLTAFIVYGVSIGGLVIPVYSELVKIATHNGYPNDLRTQGIISGIFSSIFSAGALIGPLVGGYVVEKIGFNMASFYIVLMFTLTDFFYALFYLTLKSEFTLEVEPSETSALLN